MRARDRRRPVPPICSSGSDDQHSLPCSDGGADGTPTAASTAQRAARPGAPSATASSAARSRRDATAGHGPTRSRSRGGARPASSRTRRPRARTAAATRPATTQTAAAEDQAPGRAEVLGDPADHRRTDGRAAHEAHEVQRHDPAAHLRVDAELHEAVVGHAEHQRGRAGGHQQHGEGQRSVGISPATTVSSAEHHRRRRPGTAAAAGCCAGWTAARRSASRRRRRSTAGRTPRRRARTPRGPSARWSPGS